jgi:PKD repeat protein
MSGVVVWVSSNNNVWYASYDPQRVSWQTGNISGYGSNLMTLSGVITWLGSNNNIYYTIYDPLRGVWSSGNVAGYGSGLTITVATVFWIDNHGLAQTRGFNCASGNWNDNATQSFAYFIASPDSGNSPLWVWFTDMSIGVTSWTWTFGDGQVSTNRSTSHIYLNQGVYPVIQTVTGPGGNTSWHDTVIVQPGASLEELSSLFQAFALVVSIPNPCRSYTTISYTLPRNAKIRLQIYKTSGILIRTLVSGVEARGLHHVTWDGRDEKGRKVSKGLYFYRLEVGSFTQTQKIVKIE